MRTEVDAAWDTLIGDMDGQWERTVIANRPAIEAAIVEEAVARVRTAFDEYLWGLSIAPQAGLCQESVEYFRDSLLADLAILEEHQE